MKSFIALTSFFVSITYAQQGAWQQCGGQDWTGVKSCISGYYCSVLNTWYSQCIPQQVAWGQCGGEGWTGATSCVSGYYCSYVNTWYYQCIPSTGTTTASATTTTTKASTATTSGKVTYAGVNIAGMDFGCGTDGTDTWSQNIAYPLSSLGGADGLGQMKHFINDDHFNIFRLPVGWQFLVNNNLGGSLDSNNFGKYDALVQACLSTGATCIIDIHNYARWNGGIIGQGGPSNAQFASLWTQLAGKYKNNAKIFFGLINEPHDLNVQTWASTVQYVVSAIRNAGATSNTILLPGTDWCSVQTFISSGSAAALLGVKNPDGTTNGLVFDLHKYLDATNSLASAECVTNNIDLGFSPVATWLRTNKRKAIQTETGGGNTSSCFTYLCQQVAYINANSDVYIGYLGWAAGAFSSTDPKAETPSYSNGVWTDQQLLKKCLAR